MCRFLDNAMFAISTLCYSEEKYEKKTEKRYIKTKKNEQKGKSSQRGKNKQRETHTRRIGG